LVKHMGSEKVLPCITLQRSLIIFQSNHENNRCNIDEAKHGDKVQSVN
jgi:hypothetical protein